MKRAKNLNHKRDHPYANTPPYSLLGNRIDTLLNLMRYLSHASAARAMDAPRIKSASDTQAPTVPGESLFDRWTSPTSELALVIAKMERDLKRATHSPGAVERKEDRDKRIVAQYAGIHASHVAVWEDLSPQAVRDIRKKAGVDQVEGRAAA